MLKVEHEVFTIGYQGKDIHSFIAELKENKIKLLIDVRASPFSRKPYFSRTKLREKTEEHGVEFLAIPEVGSPAELRKQLKETNDFTIFFEKYMKHIKENELFPRLSRHINGDRVCLMCFEKDANECHRSILANMIEETMNAKIKHL